MLKDVTKVELANSISEGKGVQILNFHAIWCGPCKLLSPVLAELSEKNNVEVFKVDVEKDRHFAMEMGVQGTPTSFVYKDGKLVKTLVGYLAYEQFLETLSDIL